MAPELTFVDKIRKRLNVNRLDRMVQHYVAIKENLVLKAPADKEEAAFFLTEFERYAKTTNRLSNIRFILYVLLYATLLINMLKVIPFLAFLVAFIELGSAIFGTTVLLAAVFLLSIKIRLNLELMQDCMMHLVVIYHKNQKRDAKSMLAKVAKAI